MALRADDVDLDRDRTLVRRFQEGDDEAFDELYRRYHDRLERFCRKRVSDCHVAEEVTQEAFTRALTALPDLTGEQRFYPWVSVIAARLCVDSYRRQLRLQPASDLDPGSISGGEEAIVDAVDASLAMAALARLAPRHQDVLHLREVEGWSYQHIADHYGVPVGTVETLLFRARRALRREFHLVDRAGLMALPVVGWMIRFAARARHKIPSWVPSAPSSAGIAAAATATAAAVAIAVVPFKARITPRADPAPMHAAAQPSPGGTVGSSAQPSPATVATTSISTSTTTVPVGDMGIGGLVITPAIVAPAGASRAAAPAAPTTTVVPLPDPSGAAGSGGDPTPVTVPGTTIPGPLGALTSQLGPPLSAVTGVVSNLPTVPDIVGSVIAPVTGPVPAAGPTVSSVTTTVNQLLQSLLRHP